jgi:hypothetical protein
MEQQRLHDGEVGATESDPAAVLIAKQEPIDKVSLGCTTLRFEMASSSGHKWVQNVFSSQSRKPKETVSVPNDLRKWRSHKRWTGFAFGGLRPC